MYIGYRHEFITLLHCSKHYVTCTSVSRHQYHPGYHPHHCQYHQPRRTVV